MDILFYGQMKGSNQGGLHTNFRLSNNGEQIVLSNSLGQIIDSMPFQPNPPIFLMQEFQMELALLYTTLLLLILITILQVLFILINYNSNAIQILSKIG